MILGRFPPQTGVGLVHTLPPVLPETAAPRVEKGPVIAAPCVDERSWPGVSDKSGESEDWPPACGCPVSQGGSVVGGTEVGEKAAVRETAEPADRTFVLSESGE